MKEEVVFYSSDTFFSCQSSKEYQEKEALLSKLLTSCPKRKGLELSFNVHDKLPELII